MTKSIREKIQQGEEKETVSQASIDRKEKLDQDTVKEIIKGKLIANYFGGKLQGLLDLKYTRDELVNIARSALATEINKEKLVDKLYFRKLVGYNL